MPVTRPKPGSTGSGPGCRSDPLSARCIGLDRTHFGVPGAQAVAEAIMQRAAISGVNYCEVATRLYDAGMAGDEVAARLSRYQLDVIAFEQGQALAAAALRSLTRHLGLSLGDRACLALARHLGLPAMTAERAWAQLDLGIPVQVIR